MAKDVRLWRSQVFSLEPFSFSPTPVVISSSAPEFTHFSIFLTFSHASTLTSHLLTKFGPLILRFKSSLRIRLCITFCFLLLTTAGHWINPGSVLNDLNGVISEYYLIPNKGGSCPESFIYLPLVHQKMEEGIATHQYSCLENPLDRGTWRATVQGVVKSRTWLKQLSMHIRKCTFSIH